MGYIYDLQEISDRLIRASERLGNYIVDAEEFDVPADRTGDEWAQYRKGLEANLRTLGETVAHIPVDRSKSGVHALHDLQSALDAAAARVQDDPVGVKLDDVIRALIPIHEASVTLMRDVARMLDGSQTTATPELDLLMQERAEIEATESSLAAVETAILAALDDFERLGGHPAIWNEMERINDNLQMVAQICEDRVASDAA